MSDNSWWVQRLRCAHALRLCCSPHRLFTYMQPKPTPTWLVNTTSTTNRLQECFRNQNLVICLQILCSYVDICSQRLWKVWFEFHTFTGKFITVIISCIMCICMTVWLMNVDPVTKLRQQMKLCFLAISFCFDRPCTVEILWTQNTDSSDLSLSPFGP